MRNIGLLVGSTDENGFENWVVQGAAEVARELGARLVCFDGGYLVANRGNEAMRNLLYSLSSVQPLDALVISAAITHNLKRDESVRFVASFSPTPVVTVGVEVPGLSSVTHDNRKGMGELMEHLLLVHQVRRVGFLGGPPGQPEAEARREAFEQALNRRGVTLDARWTTNGDFSRESGREALERWVERGPLDLDCLVCANDAMALGAYEVLARQGLRVPEDLLLTGYDDDEDCLVHHPTLTSVRQSPREQGREAVRLALTLAEGTAGLSHSVIGATLRPRQSCGCGTGAVHSDFDELSLRIDHQVVMRRLLDLSEHLSTALSSEALASVLATGLPRLGLKGAWVTEYVDPGEPPAGLKLLQSFDPSGERDEPVSVFPTRDLLPGGLAHLSPDHGYLVVHALYYHDQQRGLMVCSLDHSRLWVASALRIQLSAAIQAVRLLEERVAGQRRLFETEKRVALAHLVAGLAHEINTPLGVAITGVSLLAETASEATRLPLELVGRSLERTAHLVSVFKSVAVDPGSETLQTFSIDELLSALVPSLERSGLEQGVRTTMVGSGGRVSSFPGTIARVVQELYGNALTHAFPERDEEQRIVITLGSRGSWVVLSVEDNGVGSDRAFVSQFFEPFFTTRRGRGNAGLGLTIAQTLVAEVLRGTIACDLKADGGCRFDVEFPRVQGES